jgi:BMFP domain-containing protein YqiC
MEVEPLNLLQIGAQLRPLRSNKNRLNFSPIHPTYRGHEKSMTPSFIDELAKRLSDAIPSGPRQLGEDLEKNLKAVLQSAFAKMNLVSREEFEVQSQVLARTRAMVETLEKQVKELEAKVLKQDQ